MFRTRDVFSGLCLLVLVAMLWPAQLPAQITAVQVTPAQGNIALNRNASFRLVWSVTTDAGPVVSSQQGVLADASGNVYLSVPQALLVNASVSLDVTGNPIPLSVQLPETLSIPAAVVARAAQAGVSRLYYRRSFADGSIASGAPPTAAIALDITGAGGAPFAVNYIGLRFDDGSLRRVLAVGEELRARATIRFTGTGRLRGVWEIADPASSAGAPVYRPLRVVQQPLFGGRAASLDSPPLPSQQPGLYRLRLRVIEPADSGDTVSLQYFVAAASSPPLAPVEVIAPQANAVLRDDTVFRWQPVSGAVAYRLEFHQRNSDGKAGDAPLAGMEVDASRRSLVASQLMRRHLQPGGSYRWRLIALDASGQRIARSEWRPIRSGDGH